MDSIIKLLNILPGSNIKSFSYILKRYFADGLGEGIVSHNLQRHFREACLLSDLEDYIPGIREAVATRVPNKVISFFLVIGLSLFFIEKGYGASAAIKRSVKAYGKSFVLRDLEAYIIILTNQREVSHEHVG